MTQGEPFFRHHVFFCTNGRPEGHVRGSCADRGAVRLRNYMKARAKELGLDGVRINASGCLDRCECGPVLVVYPEEIWYRCRTREDIDAVLTGHLQNGVPVERLMLGNDD